MVSDKVRAVANILFDEGAQRSFISQQLASTLNLTPLRQESITLAPFGSDTMTPQNLSVALINIVAKTGELIPLSVLVVPRIAAPLQTVSHAKLTSLPYLHSLTLAHPITGDKHFEISLLIGVDHYWKLVGDHTIRGDGPTAVQSKLGYLLSGPLHLSNHRTEIVSTFHVSVSPSIEQTIEKFWSIESAGTLPAQPQSCNQFTDNYLKSIVQDESGSYVAKFPWKNDHAPLPTNFKVCARRTRALARRLTNTPDLLQMYNNIIKEQERRGFIEKIDSSPSNSPVHYIPHHHVSKESKTTPIRIVYDCSCRLSANHPSLNDCLEIGPSLVNDLCSILLRFRVHKFGLSTDIEKAFLHVKLNASDQDFTRFLWLSNPQNPESDLDTYRFKVVLFGSASSPFMLGATLRLHLNKHDSEIAHDMQKNLYVDNVISGSPSEESAVSYFHEARKIMSEANFNLRSWASNSQQLQAIARDSQVIDENQVVNVLGLHWDTTADRICFIPKSLDSITSSVVTKRSILQDSSRVYDPLGILSPVTIRAKLLMLELWQQSVDWDEPLEQQMRDKWRDIATDLQNATVTTLTRRYFPSESNSDYHTTHLHIFADASMKAYGAVVYICDDNNASFVIAKTCVAPIKPLTLPQLELMAALVAARLGKFVLDSLGNHYNISLHLWSDSQIVLHWLNSGKKLKQFVVHRIQEISLTFPAMLWHYCPTGDNPADLVTRGTTSAALSSSLWTNGPSWLTDESKWPQWNPSALTLHLQTDIEEETDHLVPTEPPELTTGIHKIIEISRYSSLTKLLRITSYVLRFITNLRNPTDKQAGTLSVSELSTAEFKWILNCQQLQFPSEIQYLKSGVHNNKKRPVLVRQLQLFLDDEGYLRCGGRIHNAPVSRTTKFPYLLPPRHTMTNLIVQAAHITQLHGRVNRTVTALRQKFWIISARRCVRSILKACVPCRKTCGNPYLIPDPPPLPESRTKIAPPFTVTGVDITGALYVRSRSGEEKAYICLFTCANTRAIHLEVVSDLTEDSFLQAFRRFVSRRSLPETMISDNASTYLSAATEIEQLISSPTLQDTLKNRGTTWRFIPKRAPWYGGFWERLIGLTKMTLKKVLGRTFISLTGLQTMTTEIEAVLNDRPITYISSDISDPEPLTPAHLLYGLRIVTLPYPSTDGSEIDDPDYGSTSTGTDLRTRVARHAQVLQHFQQRWKQEYLTSLRECHTSSGHNE